MGQKFSSKTNRSWKYVNTLILISVFTYYQKQERKFKRQKEKSAKKKERRLNLLSEVIYLMKFNRAEQEVVPSRSS